MEDSAASSICGLAKILWHDRQGSRSCSAIVFEQTSHAVKLSTTVALPLFGRVRVAFGGLKYRARVESVKTIEPGYETQLELQDKRRIDERLPCSVEMKLQRKDGADPVVVEATNYSSGGLQVASCDASEVGAVVCLSVDTIDHYGVVRYCRPAVSGYLLGIELIDEPTAADVH